MITDPEKLEGIRQRESDITKEKVLKILAAGTNVVLVTGGIDDLCLKVSNLRIHLNYRNWAEMLN